jgi:hypothetical protein
MFRWCRDMFGQYELWMEAKGQPLSNCMGDNVIVAKRTVRSLFAIAQEHKSRN